MNGVPSDTREPATTQPTKRARCSWWWGSALALSGLTCCALPPLAWQAPALAQSKERTAVRSTQPRVERTRADVVDDELDAKPTREPWQVLTQPEEVNENPIVDIRIEGNISIPDASILRMVKTRKGRPATPKAVREDVKALFESRWFTGVTPIYRTTDEGTVLIFRVIEAPILQDVKYLGNKKIKTRVLEGVTGLRKGGAFGVVMNREAAKAIERYYKDKGYHFCKVSLQKGNSDDDREVAFEIDEGPKTFVKATVFKGNEFFTAGELRLHIQTSARPVTFVPLGGTYNPTSLEDDIAGLREYYQKLGFLEAKITATPEFAADNSSVTMIYEIQEGMRFKVGQISIKGNEVLSDETLRKDFKLEEQNYFNADKLNRDVEGMTTKYGELGRLFAEVNAVPIFLPDQPGVVDIVYNINEDKVWRIRRVDVVVNGGNGNPSHTKDTVVLNQMLVAPGDLANKVLIKKSERRIASSSFFANAQTGGQPPRIDIRPVTGMNNRPSTNGLARAQDWTGEEKPVQQTTRSVEPLFPIPKFPKNPHTVNTRPAQRATTEEQEPEPIRPRIRQVEYSEDNELPAEEFHYEPPKPARAKPVRAKPGRAKYVAPISESPQSSLSTHEMLREVFDGVEQSNEVAAADPADVDEDAESIDQGRTGTVIRGQGPGLDGAPAQNPLFNNSPMGDPYGNPMLAPSPDSNWVDLIPSVTETQTGRISFGVGVNSDAGLLGNAIIDESNFDILRVPTSFRDILNGTAFRGGGQLIM